MKARPFLYLYQAILHLFPRSFQQDFGAEMRMVFEDVLEDAAGKGQPVLVRAALREIASLPLAALRLHLAGEKSLPGARFPGWEGPPTRNERLLLLVLFALPILGLYSQPPAFISSQWLVYLICGLAIGVLVAGFVQGFPRWSLPYLGLVLSSASFVLIMQCGADSLSPQALAKLEFLPQNESTRLVAETLWSGLVWLSLFVTVGLFLGLLLLLKRCQLMLRRIRQDWTLVSYILYGGILAGLGLSFYYHFARSIYAVASILCLALGAWLFLRGSQPWQRLLALLAGLTLAVTAATAGQWPLHPLDRWESDLWQEISVRSGLLLVIVEWGWMVVFLLAPVMLYFLPRKRCPSKGLA